MRYVWTIAFLLVFCLGLVLAQAQPLTHSELAWKKRSLDCVPPPPTMVVIPGQIYTIPGSTNITVEIIPQQHVTSYTIWRQCGAVSNAFVLCPVTITNVTTTNLLTVYITNSVETSTNSTPPIYYISANSACGSNTPILITNIMAWYMADAGVTNLGSRVDTWGDQSGNGFHLTTNAASLGPVVAAASLNGLPTIRCDWDTPFSFQADTLVSPVMTNFVQPFTVVMVFRTKSDPTDFGFPPTQPARLIFSSSGSLHMQFASQVFMNAFLGDAEPGGGSAFGVGVSGAPILKNQWHTATVVANGANSKIRIDGVESTGDCGTGDLASGFFIGGRINVSRGYCDYAEIMIFPKVRSASEIAEDEGYLTNKWGL